MSFLTPILIILALSIFLNIQAPMSPFPALQGGGGARPAACCGSLVCRRSLWPLWPLGKKAPLAGSTRDPNGRARSRRAGE